MDTYIAFIGYKCIASGPLEIVLQNCKAQPEDAAFLIFHQQTGKQVDFDFRGSMEEILARIAPKPERTGPGRPKLGVISREVTLLPRHWEWLEMQPSGASAALRRLVEDARKNQANSPGAIDATGRIMTAVAGNLPGFEEAYRAIYARDRDRMAAQVKDWPEDIRSYVLTSW